MQKIKQKIKFDKGVRKMAGHSKWANIRHRKAAVDAKRGKIFTKLVREIIVAAREGGGDPDSNPRLRTIIEKAKQANMPKEKIEQAIKRGTGELKDGQSLEEIYYEGYGPGGVAILVYTVTDNKNRTAAEIRHIFSKHGGNLGESGCVAWIFERRGWIEVDMEGKDEDELMEVAIEAGADDVEFEDGKAEIVCEPDSFVDLKTALEKAGYKIVAAEITMLPKNKVKLEGEDARKCLKLMEALEDHDDVQQAYANFEIDEAVMEEIAQ